MIYDIEKNLPDIVSEIEKRCSEFKILTKVKNESALLPLWLEHLKSMEFENKDIIIFDNDSDDEEFIKILTEISSEITVVRHSYNMDAIHVPAFLPGIYKAICNSSEFFCFIDVDEFIYKFDIENKKISPTSKKEILERLVSLREFDCFSLPWVQVYNTNFAEQSDLYKIFDFGKVIVNSKNFLEKFENIKSDGTIMHMRHIPFFYKELRPYPKFTEFFILHNKFLAPGRVIETNKRKIKLKLNSIGYKKSVEDIVKDKENTLNSIEKIDYRTFWFISYNLKEIEFAENVLEGKVSFPDKKHLSEEEAKNLETLMRIDFYRDFPDLTYSEYFFLVEMLSKSEVYLEYGTGSTIPLAAKLGNKNLILSSNNDLPELEKKLEYLSAYLNFKFLVNVAENIKDYLLFPWKSVAECGVDPDLIFIDSKNGLEALLVSLLFAKDGSTIILNGTDLLTNLYFHKLEKAIKQDYKVDRFCVFRKDRLTREDIIKKMLIKIIS